MKQTNNPGQRAEPRKPSGSFFQYLTLLVIAIVYLLCLYCAGVAGRMRGEHSGQLLDDSIRKVLDDTLQINAGKIPEMEVPNE